MCIVFFQRCDVIRTASIAPKLQINLAIAFERLVGHRDIKFGPQMLKYNGKLPVKSTWLVFNKKDHTSYYCILVPVIIRIRIA